MDFSLGSRLYGDSWDWFSRTVNLIRGPIHMIFLMNYELDRRSFPLDAYLYDRIFSCFYFCFQLSRTYELLVDFWNAVSIHHVIPHWLILLELHGSVFVRRPLVRRCQNKEGMLQADYPHRSLFTTELRWPWRRNRSVAFAIGQFGPPPDDAGQIAHAKPTS